MGFRNINAICLFRLGDKQSYQVRKRKLLHTSDTFQVETLRAAHQCIENVKNTHKYKSLPRPTPFPEQSWNEPLINTPEEGEIQTYFA